MSDQYSSVGELNREIAMRCRDIGLQFDCGSDGLFNAEIAIVAEAPGEREKAIRTPLVGGSGSYLWQALRPYGIDRRKLYITNVIKRQLTSFGTDDKLKISHSELDHWHGILDWELSQLPNLKYVLVLGNFALKALTGETGIINWRGSVMPAIVRGKSVTAICTLNPAMIMREKKFELVFKMDMHRFNRVVTGQWKEHHVEAHINPSFDEARSFIRRMGTESAQGLPVALDIEVLGTETACIGLANSSTSGMCIPFKSTLGHYWTEDQEDTIRGDIAALAALPSCKLVAQNGVFDSSWLWYKDRLRLPKVWFDTLLAHHLLYPSLPHNLGFLTTQYTTHPFYKDEGKAWRATGDLDRFWRYNVLDACLTLACQKALLEELRTQKMDTTFFRHIMRLQPHLVEMEVLGVKCDVAYKDQLAEQLATDLIGKREEFYKAVAEATGDVSLRPNLRSPAQMKALWFHHLKLIGRGTATDKTNRDHMRKHPRTSAAAIKCINAFDAYVTDEKFYSTYATAGVDPDNRLRCEYKQFGTTSAPGRLSSSGTLWGSGMNLQNQPKRAYHMFLADEGCELGYFDMSQIEARIVGWLANIQTWKEQFEKARKEGGYDAHRALASTMFGVPYDETPTEDELDGKPTIRFIAKRCRHGLNYGMHSQRLSEVTGLPLADCERHHATYHRIHPELRLWWQNTVAGVRRDKQLHTPYGRRWMLLERYDDEVERTLIAFVPQSTAGDHVAGVIYLAHEDPEWPHGKARILMNIHDALVTLHKPEVRDTVFRILKKHAERPIYIRGEPLIIPAEFKVSVPGPDGQHRWSKMQKVKV